ncbi:hypothetical protein [Teredinibacter haidensis]|uniref:hypothetical protein n=1 Tax=Teredinibacter haidensis TaxID=2731755 RepID=UPI000948C03A|nr:hypothetical protein [Teredinibacter haidensis]
MSVTACAEGSSPPSNIIYPESLTLNYQQRDAYFVKLLTLALEKSGASYTLSKKTLPTMSESRSAIYLQQNRYTIHWFMTNNIHETRLIPIRIPLYKGLAGWRLFFIHPESIKTFAGINNVEKLKRYRAVQGTDWPDSPVLKSNGFRLSLSPQWESMIELTHLKRIDYFPRALTEIWQEAELIKSKNLTVEHTLVLQYPAAYYFFVGKQYSEQAKMIEKGLHAAIADGSFNALFLETFGEDIAKSNIGKRRILRINNPLLPPRTPLNTSKLWYTPSGAKD